MQQILITSTLGEVLLLELPERRITCNGASYLLKATPCRLMHLLLLNTGEIVSRKKIYKEIWGYDFDPGTKIIEVHVYYLRRTLASLNSLFEIKTHRGQGISLQPIDNSQVRAGEVPGFA
ncbi:winged helix-turn-helix domain-containing protein [Pseudomonas monteilii]|uniref:winged helix-turn-helix domain-containing protein n=1 Tax=Pseudomonas monteilii TaxID=76759 RepID=UPI003D077B51